MTTMQVTQAWLENLSTSTRNTVNLSDLLHAYLPTQLWEKVRPDQRSLSIPTNRELVDAAGLAAFRDQHGHLLNATFRADGSWGSFSDEILRTTPLSYPFMVELGLVPGIRWFGGRIDKLRQMMEAATVISQPIVSSSKKNQSAYAHVRALISSIRTVVCQMEHKSTGQTQLSVVRQWNANADESVFLDSINSEWQRATHVALTFPYDVGSLSLNSLPIIRDAQMVPIFMEDE